MRLLGSASFFSLSSGGLAVVSSATGGSVPRLGRRGLEAALPLPESPVASEAEGPSVVNANGAEPDDLSGYSIKFVSCRNLVKEVEEEVEGGHGVLAEEYSEELMEQEEEEEEEEEMMEVELVEAEAEHSHGGQGQQAASGGADVDPLFDRKRLRGGRRNLDVHTMDEPEPRALVTFRFCPDDVGCQGSCDSSEYEEMTVDMRTYLDVVLSFKRDEQETYCKTCGECYQFLKIEEEGGESDIPAVCDGLEASCHDECLKIENMEEDGFVDASEFVECRPVVEGRPSFAGARCDETVNGIKISLFEDEECTAYVGDFAESMDWFGVRLDYRLLDQTFTKGGACVASCGVEAADWMALAEHQNVNSDSFIPGVDGICQELHDAYRRQQLPQLYEIGAGDAHHQDEHDAGVGSVTNVNGDDETCVFQTPGGQYYAGRYCEFPATSICLHDDDGNAGGINAGTPHFCTNNGTCQTIDRVGDSIDDAFFHSDHFGISDNGFYCACLPQYYGRYCEMVVPEAGVEPLSDDDAMVVDEYDDDDMVGDASSPTEYAYVDSVAAGNYTVRERRALLDFFHKGGWSQEWENQDGWLSDAPVCEWYGVTCDKAGSVTHLELVGNSMRGLFEGSFLAQLGNLTVLDLSDNDMSGTISEDMGGLVRLKRLDLGNNNLRGYVPSSLSRLTRLEVLDLRQNGFSAFPMDTFTSATLDKLARVDVSSNMIAGTMPYKLFSSNPDLLHLNMSNNRLMGTIPGAILDTAFEKPFSMEGRSGDPLEYVLDLSFNQLEGRVPNFYAENLTLGVVGNRFADIDPGACDQDWNDGATKSFGCDGIACPIGTANSEGRQSTDDNPCMNCTSARFLGTVMFEIDEDECEVADHTGGNPFDQVYRPTPQPISPPASSYLEVLSPLTLVKEGGYEHLLSLFGPRNFFGRLSVETNVYYADSDLCDADVNTSIGYPIRDQEDGVMLPWPTPFILMVDRGGCTFVTKVRNAQSVGALAVIIADNTCLCEMLDSCTSDPGQSDCETRWPVIADDGSGSDIYIPSLLMLKQDADLIKAEVRANRGVLMKITFPEQVLSFVEYELWMSPVDAALMEFLATFKEYAEALSGYARFVPRLFIFDGIRAGCMDEEGSNVCYNECTNGGRYCATDPDTDLDSSISGADVVREGLRWLCIWQEDVVNDGFRAQWWEYVSNIPMLVECAGDSFPSEDCAISAMSKAYIDSARIARCMEGTGGLEGRINKLLEEQLDMKEAFGIVEVPTFRVNESPIDGVLDAANALEAICSGFAAGREPPICRSNEAMTPDPPISPQQLEAQWFQTTYADYATACTNQGDEGLKMCPYDVYCPSGKGTDPFRGGPPEVYNNNGNNNYNSNWDELEAMQWAPYYDPEHDGSNPALLNWVQIGRLDGNGVGTEDNSSGKCWKYDDLYEGTNIEEWKDEHPMWILCCVDDEAVSADPDSKPATGDGSIHGGSEEGGGGGPYVPGYSNVGRGSCQDGSGKMYSYIRYITLSTAEVCGSRQMCDKYKTSESYRGFEFSVTKRCICLFDRDELPLISESEYEYVSAVNDGYGAVSGVSGTPGVTCYKIIQESTAGTLDGANGGPLTASAPNHTSFDSTDNPSQEPSSQPSNVPSVQTSMPTGGPTEFVDTMASDTNACRKAFPSWKILLLLAPFILW